MRAERVGEARKKISQVPHGGEGERLRPMTSKHYVSIEKRYMNTTRITPTKPPVSLELLEQIVRGIHEVAAAGLLPLTQGNMSLRDPETGFIVVTPHDLPYDELGVSDLVVSDINGEIFWGGREPSIDASVHRIIYRERNDVNAVLHTEPLHVNALGVIGDAIPVLTTLGLKSLRQPVPIMPFSAVRDETFALEMLRAMGHGTAVVWRNHGLLVCGASSEEVVRRSIGIEYNAEVACLVRACDARPQTLRYSEAGIPEVASSAHVFSQGREGSA